MTIMNPMYGELDHLHRRMREARSGDEMRYYEEKLYRLEREMTMMMPSPMQYEQMRIAPRPMPTSLGAAPETPLSFLKYADKKLLLTGATS